MNEQSQSLDQYSLLFDLQWIQENWIKASSSCLEFKSCSVMPILFNIPSRTLKRIKTMRDLFH